MNDDLHEDATPEDCKHQDAVMWNPYIHAVSCHRCGLIFAPWDYKTPLQESITPRLDVYASPVPARRAGPAAAMREERMMASDDAMSDARLAEIRPVLEQMYRISERGSYSEKFYQVSLELLAEVEQARAREAALLEVVERVAEAGIGDNDNGGTWLMFSGYDAETVRQQARALLASEQPARAAPRPLDHRAGGGGPGPS